MRATSASLLALACTLFALAAHPTAASPPAAGLLSRQDDPPLLPLGAKCTEDFECFSYECRDGTCQGAPTQSICRANISCYSRVCSKSVGASVGFPEFTLCKAQAPLQKCRDSADCQIELKAVCGADKRCRLPTGTTCKAGAQCVSGKCRSGKCA